MIRSMMGRKKKGGIAIDSAPYGIYILRTDDRLYTREMWDRDWNSEAVGVAVVTENCRFVIAPEEASTGKYWSPNRAYDIVPGVAITEDEATAYTDYEGFANTSAIVAKYGKTSDYAAYVCKSFSFKNRKKGYLGSAGEWKEAYKNKAEVDACMDHIYAKDIAPNYPYWTSTQYDYRQAWEADWDFGIVDTEFKHNYGWIRPFAPL